MVENIARKITLIVVLLAASIGILVLKDKPFNLGLDLAGGTRLVYSFDLDAAIAKGLISPQEAQNPAQLISDTISIIKERVDPTGVLEVVVRAEGTNRIVVELPGTLTLDKEPATGKLIDPLPISASGQDESIQVDDALFTVLPDSGYLKIDGETIAYGAKAKGTPEKPVPPDTLVRIIRAQRRSDQANHLAGAKVTQVIDDPIKDAITSLGELSFEIVAEPGDGIDLDAEKQKLKDWVAKNPGVGITTFNRVAPADGGPDPRIEWYPMSYGGNKAAQGIAEVDRASPLLRPQNEDQVLRGENLSRVYPTVDNFGFPAVGFEFDASKKSAFTDFTESNVGRHMAIVLNGEVYTDPTINSTLYGGGIIQGQFSNEEMQALVNVLRSGSLKIEPKLENEMRVGASLGDEYVRRGLISGLVATLAVLGFMIVYYRKLGTFSALSMLAAFLMLLGGLSFLNATLTLPGIAGILLTVGMAVDANILIFDRIREEMDKGRNVKQASKTGFEKALSAILDANITTMLTAIILYRVGTGPVRGFAVTLMIGIVTSVFAALVITRLFVHYSLERGNREFKVGTWMVTANYDFLGKTKYALLGSGLLIVFGVGLFITYPDSEKFGIDFLGGGEVQIRVAQAMQTGDVEKLVKEIPGAIGESSSVRAVADTSAGGGKYTDFQISFKLPKDERAAGEQGGDSGENFRATIASSLKDILLPDGVQEISRTGVPDSPGKDALKMRIVFAEAHSPADVQSRISESAGLPDVQVEKDENADGHTYVASTDVSTERPTAEILDGVRSAFRNAHDSTGAKFTLATAIPSSSSVGPQVVGELRDKAILAILISLFAIVLYIRVRFAEYSYGFAAVAALAHDVLVTLGALTIANHLKILDGEITLPMIAAFLTIIGYSLNDTIVIFDRVRENLPRMKAPLRQVLNDSINQTLSRTVLTSGTTLLAVMVLFFWNLGTGNVLESFSFAMGVGVITGTYSTIYIANPIFLWLENKARARRKRLSEDDRVARAGEAPAKA